MACKSVKSAGCQAQLTAGVGGAARPRIKWSSVDWSKVDPGWKHERHPQQGQNGGNEWQHEETTDANVSHKHGRLQSLPSWPSSRCQMMTSFSFWLPIARKLMQIRRQPFHEIFICPGSQQETNARRCQSVAPCAQLVKNFLKLRVFYREPLTLLLQLFSTSPQ